MPHAIRTGFIGGTRHDEDGSTVDVQGMIPALRDEVHAALLEELVSERVARLSGKHIDHILRDMAEEIGEALKGQGDSKLVEFLEGLDPEQRGEVERNIVRVLEPVQGDTFAADLAAFHTFDVNNALRNGVQAAPGASEALRALQEDGARICIVTTSSPERIASCLQSSQDALAGQTQHDYLFQDESTQVYTALGLPDPLHPLTPLDITHMSNKPSSDVYLTCLFGEGIITRREFIEAIRISRGMDSFTSDEAGAINQFLDQVEEQRRRPLAEVAEYIQVHMDGYKLGATGFEDSVNGARALLSAAFLVGRVAPTFVVGGAHLEGQVDQHLAKLDAVVRELGLPFQPIVIHDQSEIPSVIATEAARPPDQWRAEYEASHMPDSLHGVVVEGDIPEVPQP
jgi:hypothetical protein